MLVFVEVSLDKTTPDAFEKFAAAVRRAPEVLECHMVAGGFDYLVKTRVADMAAYRRFLGEILLALPGVKETRTYAVMEEVKSDGAAAGIGRTGGEILCPAGLPVPRETATARFGAIGCDPGLALGHRLFRRHPA